MFPVASPVTVRLNRWLEAFDALMTTMTTKVDMATLVDIHILRTYHQCLEVMGRVAPFGREVIFDAYLNIYEHVLFKLGLFVKVADVKLTSLFLFPATPAQDSVMRCCAIDLLR